MGFEGLAIAVIKEAVLDLQHLHSGNKRLRLRAEDALAFIESDRLEHWADGVLKIDADLIRQEVRTMLTRGGAIRIAGD